MTGEDDINVDDLFNFVEDEPNTISNGDMSLYSFVSSLTADEIGDYFDTFKINYFLFDVDNNSTFNLTNDKLMGVLKSNLNAKQKTNDIIDLLELNSIDYFTEDDVKIEKMDRKEVLIEINSILDKGYDKMDEYDKKYITKLYGRYND